MIPWCPAPWRSVAERLTALDRAINRELWPLGSATSASGARHLRRRPGPSGDRGRPTTPHRAEASLGGTPWPDDSGRFRQESPSHRRDQVAHLSLPDPGLPAASPLARTAPMRHAEDMPKLTLEPSSEANPHDPRADVAGVRAIAVARAAAVPLVTHAGTTIRIGTASWTDPTMTAPCLFDPRAPYRRRTSHLLRGSFPIVEIDATNHALPSPRVAEAWTPAPAGLCVRCQGPRADDRPADRGEEAAEGHPQRAAANSRPGRAVHAPRPPFRAARRGPGTCIWPGFSPFAPQPASWARCCSSIHAGSFPRARAADLYLESRSAEMFAARWGLRSETWFSDRNRERTLHFLADNAIPPPPPTAHRVCAAAFPPSWR